MNKLMLKQKVVLINTPYLYLYGDLKSSAGLYFNLGLGYIAAVLRDNNYEVEFIEPLKNFSSYSELSKHIAKVNPILVGISCVTPNFNEAKKIIYELKKEYSGKIVIGGAHASFFRGYCFKECSVLDYLVFGEGEFTMLELCNALKNNENNFSDIKGLCWKKGDSVYENIARPYINDLNTIPFPDRSHVDIFKYAPQTFLKRSEKSISILTSRGCPARCVFCASKITMGGEFRYRSPDNILDEIKYLIDFYGADYFLIKDDTFTINRGRVVEFCEKIIENNLKFKWHCMLRANTVDLGLLTLMKKAGCSDVFIGVETGNEDTLRKIKKGITKSQIVMAFENCKKVGIDVMASFILGFPWETKEMMSETVKFACELNPLFAGFAILIPYPGSELFNLSIPPSDYSYLDWEDFMGSSGTKSVKNFDQLDLDTLKKVLLGAQLRFYLRPSQILRLLVAAFKNPMLLKGIIISSFDLFKKFFHIITGDKSK